MPASDAMADTATPEPASSTPANDASVKMPSATPEPMSKVASPRKSKHFSWLDPHPTFVIIFVGKEERPFGIQKDFICAKSDYFRSLFDKTSGGSNSTARAGAGAGAGSSTSTPAPTAEENGNGSGETATDETTEQVENIVHLPDIAPEAFAYAQHYMYTGQLVPEADEADEADDDDDDTNEDEATPDDRTGIPSYDILVSIWKLAHRLGIRGLCDRTLEAMSEHKRLTMTIPATATLVQVWHDTPAGSSIRQLLLSWAAEYLRSSEARRAAFAKALPHELLSELVVAMSSSYGDFWAMPATFGGGRKETTDVVMHDANANGHNANGTSYHTPISIGTAPAPPAKRPRYFESYASSSSAATATTSNNANARGGARGGAPELARPPVLPNNINGGRKGGGRASMPGPRALAVASEVPSPAKASAAAAAAAGLSGSPAAATPGAMVTATAKKRGHHHVVDMDAFSAEQKLRFCDDLLTRMLSGPGFWTRLVGPFREPVDPLASGVPDYFDKVKRPMDLGSIKGKLDEGRYATPDEFLADMRQIFKNVYTYWKKGDTIWQVCERLERTFEEKYAQMNKWLAKLESEE